MTSVPCAVLSLVPGPRITVRPGRRRRSFARPVDEPGVRRVYAEVFARNRASRRVLEKLGMEQEGRLRRHFRKWGESVDVEVYGLLREEHEG